MKSSVWLPLIIVMAFLLLIDAFVYRGIIQALGRMPERSLRIVKLFYWFVPLTIFVWMGTMLFFGDSSDPRYFPKFMNIIAFITLFYFPKLVFGTFQGLDDVWGIAHWIVQKLSPTPNPDLQASRSRFLLQIGLIISAIPFASVIHGVWRGRYNFRVVNQIVDLPNLPEAFNGYRILQISDAHLGSFIGKEDKIKEAVALINAQKADIVVFTGDIVNNIAPELETFVDIFGKIRGLEGQYSVLGNHDYGTHHHWQSAEAKQANLRKLMDYHKKMNFRLLMNEHVLLQRNGQEIALIGVENWGKAPFPQYGDLQKALSGAEHLPVKILLSHDPTHWDSIVLPDSDIDLTLSGHTHGMQFGIKIGSWQWSPVSIRYPHWGGMYTQGTQRLYVNRGFGVIGFPGRIGMDPELTVFELRKA